MSDTPRIVRVEERTARVERVASTAPARVVRAGLTGPQGLPGAAATTLPWTSITDKPALVFPADLEPSVDLTILFENGLA